MRVVGWLLLIPGGVAALSLAVRDFLPRPRVEQPMVEMEPAVTMLMLNTHLGLIAKAAR